MSSAETPVQNLLTVGTPSNVTERRKLRFGPSHQENWLDSGEGHHTERNSQVFYAHQWIYFIQPGLIFHLLKRAEGAKQRLSRFWPLWIYAHIMHGPQELKQKVKTMKVHAAHARLRAHPRVHVKAKWIQTGGTNHVWSADAEAVSGIMLVKITFN